jgi:hypothetical protein
LATLLYSKRIPQRGSRTKTSVEGHKLTSKAIKAHNANGVILSISLKQFKENYKALTKMQQQY